MYVEKGVNFVEACRKKHPQRQEYFRKYFQQVVCSPDNFDNELLLQAYLFFKIKTYFPWCTELFVSSAKSVLYLIDE